MRVCLCVKKRGAGREWGGGQRDCVRGELDCVGFFSLLDTGIFGAGDDRRVYTGRNRRCDSRRCLKKLKKKS